MAKKPTRSKTVTGTGAKKPQPIGAKKILLFGLLVVLVASCVVALIMQMQQNKKISTAQASAASWTQLGYHTEANSGVKASACKVKLSINKYKIKVLITRSSTSAQRTNLHYYYQDEEGLSQTLTSSSWWNGTMQLHEVTVLSSGKVSPNVRLSNGKVDQFYLGAGNWAGPGNVVNC